MNESLRDVLAREAAEAADFDARVDAGEAAEPAVQSARAGFRGGASQVYSLRIPVERVAQLRHVADARGEAPTALMRRWVLERLDAEAGAPLTPEEKAQLARLSELAAQVQQVALGVYAINAPADESPPVPRAWLDNVRDAIDKLDAATRMVETTAR